MNIQPAYKLDIYNCPNCHAMAKMTWVELGKKTMEKGIISTGFKAVADIEMVICSYCQKEQIWFQKSLICPNGEKQVPDPHTDMPERVKEAYAEARRIYSKSSVASAAFVRRALEILLTEFGYYKDRNLNAAIAKMSKENVIHKDIIKAAATIRSFGNNAMHPTALDFADNPDSARDLFNLLNAIVEELIGRGSSIQRVFALLPESEQNKANKNYNINESDK